MNRFILSRSCLFAAYVGLSASIAMSLAGSPAHAQLVLNPSFESPLVALGGFSASSIDNWTGSLGNTFRYGVTRETSLLPRVPDGLQVAYVNTNDPGHTAGSLAQTLPNPLQSNMRYDLTAQFGLRTDKMAAIGGLELYAGGMASAGNVVSGTLLASTRMQLVQGAFVLGSLTYTTGLADPLLGQNLSVRLVGAASGNYDTQINFDDVRLIARPAAVPEPGSLALLTGVGATGLLALRRGRK